MPLYSLLTRGSLRLDFARVCGASLSRAKNGFIDAHYADGCDYCEGWSEEY